MDLKTILKIKLTKPLKNERGGAHILIFVLLASMSIVWVDITTLNWMQLTTITNKTKVRLDLATQAAASNVNRTQAARGIITWDTSNGTADFYKYLQLNLKLDSSNNPIAGSYLLQNPIVQYLAFISNATYPYVFNKTITLYPSTPDQTIRNISVTLYGPSVVAIMEVRHHLMGTNRTVPIIQSSVASLRYR
jgi:hypothetical protein